MREPYRTLFDGYEDHWLLAPYLTGADPDWHGLANDGRTTLLSTGETVLLRIAHAFAGRDHHVAFAELGKLDSSHRVRVAQAILLGCEEW